MSLLGLACTVLYWECRSRYEDCYEKETNAKEEDVVLKGVLWTLWKCSYTTTETLVKFDCTVQCTHFCIQNAMIEME
jgi:hypothetical protein